MAKPFKHDIKDVKKVVEHYNNSKIRNKKKSILLAGFSDTSVYYTTIKRLKVKEDLKLSGQVEI